MAEYKSLREASRAVGLSTERIAQCCKPIYRTHRGKGFYWRSVDDDEIAEIGVVRRRNTATPVRQYTLDGSLVAMHLSMPVAMQTTGVNMADIFACCKRKDGFESAGGFIWRYITDDEYHEQS